MSNIYDLGNGNYTWVDGMLVENDALRIAEKLAEYDPNLYILCVEPHAAEISEEPFVIAEKCKDGVLRPIFRCWKLDDTVIQRVILSDGQKSNQLKTLDEMLAKQKAKRTYRYEEWRGDAKDKVKHIAGMKSKYTVKDEQTGEIITFFDDRPSERK